jgi:hypothetical protein
MRAFFATFALCFVLVAHASADDAGVGLDEQAAIDTESAPLPLGHRPSVELRIEPREGLMTGDPIRVTIAVRLPEGDDVAIPRQSFEPFELHRQEHHDRPIEGGLREYVFEVMLLALEPGEHELPALQLRVVTADGTVGSVHTEPQTITVGSLLANEPDAELRPPTAPLPVMQDDYTLAWILASIVGILLTALITWLIARWWNRRPKKVAPPPPPKPAWEIALAKLTSLRQRQGRLLEDGKHVELVDAVSDALREYFGARYDFNGLESTTDEVLSRLRNVGLGAGLQNEITVLLGECDLVKFAKALPSDEQCVRMIEGAVGIVRGTMPGRPNAAPSAPRAQPIAVQPAKIEEPPKAPETLVSAPIETIESSPKSESMANEPVHSIEEKGSPITLPLALSSVEAVDAVVSAAVLGIAEARVHDPDFNGTIVVTLGVSLPEDEGSRGALRDVHAKLNRALDGRKTASGAQLRVMIEHLHESAREAAEHGREPRKTTYGNGSTEAMKEEEGA